MKKTAPSFMINRILCGVLPLATWFQIVGPIHVRMVACAEITLTGMTMSASVPTIGLDVTVKSLSVSSEESRHIIRIQA